MNALRSNPNIIITKADKGGQIVVLDKSTYIDNVNHILNNGPYVPVAKGPSASNLNKIKLAVKTSKVIPENLKKSIIPSISNCARFYALPKVHKPNFPFRSIVSNIGTASYKLSKFLVSKFSPLQCNNIYTVKNSN